MTPAVGLLDLQNRYGKLVLGPNPTGGLKIISPIGWESANMMLVTDLPGYPHRLYVNKAIVDPLHAALSLVTSVCPDYRIRTMGCFNPRLKRVNGSISVHAWGLAVDINADTNPMGAPMKRDIPDLFVHAFVSQGFTWGGHFPTPDPQHFQFVTGY